MLTPEQEEARRGRIGSSDVGVILGLSPGGIDAEYTLWLRLIQGDTAVPDVHAKDQLRMRRGSLLEASLAQIAAEELGQELVHYPAPTVIGDGQSFPAWAVDHTDAIFGDGSLLEIKAYSQSPAELPPHVRAQCVWHLAAHPAAPHCHVIVFTRVDEVRYFRVERNETEIQDVIGRVGQWYARHVEAGVEPDWPMFAAIGKILQQTGGNPIQLPGEQHVQKMTGEYIHLQQQYRQIDEQLAEIRRQIACEMARCGASTLTVDQGKWTANRQGIRFYQRGMER